MITLGSAASFAARRITEPVQGMHDAISGSWFSVVGRPGDAIGLPTRLITSAVYGAVGIGFDTVGWGIDARRGADGSRGHKLGAIVEGFWGDDDTLVAGRSTSSLTMTNADGDLLFGSHDVIDVVPDARADIVVFVHGLAESEGIWLGTRDEPGIADHVIEESTATPVLVRYVSGLSIEENGRLLADALASVHARWPVPVRSLILVGHSMGGLVVRSAGLAAARTGHAWLADVTDVVTIAAPHRGAPLERAVRIAERALDRTPHTRPLAAFLATRSQGVRDLGHGDVGLDGLPSPDPKAVPHDVWGRARIHFLAGVITSDVDHAVGRIAGDLIVQPASGTSAPELAPTTVMVAPRSHHFGLLSNDTLRRYVLDVVTSSA
jgi:pimeloyl-ACP methyl ester carboxylesterase